MVGKTIPCGSPEMNGIRAALMGADNLLIDAQDMSIDDEELTDRILEIRRLTTKLIQDTK